MSALVLPDVLSPVLVLVFVPLLVLVLSPVFVPVLVPVLVVVLSVSSFFTSVGHPFPAVCIRTSTERPEALDKGCFVLSGIDTVGLLQSVDLAVDMVKNRDLGVPVPDYTDTNVSDKVVRIIQSYVGVVNKMVWRKE